MSEQDDTTSKTMAEIAEWAAGTREPIRKMSADLMALGEAFKSAQAAVLRKAAIDTVSDETDT